MIVRDVMATKLVTVAPDDTLAHAANLFRQHQFHHLPVVSTAKITVAQQEKTDTKTVMLLEGVLTAQDIDLAAALATQEAAKTTTGRLWQERHVFEVMHRALIRVTPTMSVAAAAQLLAERGLQYLPVVEYSHVNNEARAVLVGLLTRSDLLIALSRAMGAFEPGMQLDIALPMGRMAPLARTLLLANELHMQVRSVMAAPLETTGVPTTATLRLGTINPAPLLLRLKEEGIGFSFGSPFPEEISQEGETHA